MKESNFQKVVVVLLLQILEVVAEIDGNTIKEQDYSFRRERLVKVRKTCEEVTKLLK